MSHLQIFQRADEKWAWTLHADNGQPVSTDGGQGYENRADCILMGVEVTSGYFSPDPAHREAARLVISRTMQHVATLGPGDITITSGSLT